MSFTPQAAPNPPEYSGVVPMRLRGDDVKNLLGLYAADAETQRAGNDPRMEERLRLIPNGWRDFRLASRILARITDAIQWTVPPEKRVGFAQTAQRSRYIVMQGPLAAKPKADEEEIITTRQLDELISSAWEGRCRMCVDGQCDRSALGKVLDAFVAEDRDGGCWGTMDIRRK